MLPIMHVEKFKIPAEVGEELLKAASTAVQTVARACGEEHANKGGFFRFLLVPYEGCKFFELEPLVEGWAGGTSNQSNIAQYYHLSMEKAHRLGRNTLCLSSFESERDPEKCQFGGAIRTPCWVDGINDDAANYYISSFSGLPEEGDEAAMLLTMKLMEWMPPYYPITEMIIDRSNNQLARELLAS